jgi:serine/threonine protein kinase
MIMDNQPDTDRRDFIRFSPHTKNLLLQMLEKDPKLRITPKQALAHKFFVENGYSKV